MKFHNGCWLFKEGVGCFSPQQAYEVQIRETEVLICAPTTRIEKKGDTLGLVNLTLRITSPTPEVIRVQTWHYKGVQKKAPEFELNLPGDRALDVTQEGDLIVIKSGSLALEIDRENWAMRYVRNGELLTKSGAKDLSYVKTDWKGLPYDKGGDAWMCQQLGLSIDELIYGFGEQFTPFVKNGQSVYIWNEDGGTSTEQAYKNIPFYLSNRAMASLSTIRNGWSLKSLRSR